MLTDHCKALQLLKKHLPYKNIQRIVSCERLTGGILNNIFLIKTNDDEFVVKVFEPTNPDPSCVLSHQNIFELMQALHGKMMIPEPLGFAPDFYGKDCLIMQYIRIHSIENVSNHAYSIGKTLGQFHKHTIQLKCFQKKPNDVVMFAKEIWDASLRALYSPIEAFTTGKVGKLLTPLQEGLYLFHLFKYATLNIVDSLFTQPALTEGLVHHDFHPGNLLIDQQQQLNLIDFELCQGGFLIHDIAHALIMFCATGNKIDTSMIFDLLKGYESELPIPESEWRYLFSTALADRAALELVSQRKLYNMGKPYGSPFLWEQNTMLQTWLKHSPVNTLYQAYRDHSPSVLKKPYPLEQTQTLRFGNDTASSLPCEHITQTPNSPRSSLRATL